VARDSGASSWVDPARGQRSTSTGELRPPYRIPWVRIRCPPSAIPPSLGRWHRCKSRTAPHVSGRALSDISQAGRFLLAGGGDERDGSRSCRARPYSRAALCLRGGPAGTERSRTSQARIGGSSQRRFVVPVARGDGSGRGGSPGVGGIDLGARRASLKAAAGPNISRLRTAGSACTSSLRRSSTTEANVARRNAQRRMRRHVAGYRAGLMFDNHLYASMVFTVAFLGSICALLFLLAWLEQPASDRWKPGWNRRAVGPPRTAPETGGRAAGGRVAEVTATATRLRRTSVTNPRLPALRK
jgi:hypothetical protein